MGFALAGQLAERGARVLLVCGPVALKINHPNIQRLDVTSADQMYEACVARFPDCDGAVMTAAVADYTPVLSASEKIKRAEGNLHLELRPNRDIAAELGRIKQPGQLLVGFALETQNELENARAKLKKKNLDMIVLNSLREEGSGFGHDTNKITILTSDGGRFEYGLKSKREVAADIVERMLEINNSKTSEQAR